jgi:protein tyrosine phosphatase (PTP) superfamily phosphohydrolase (DUF442 family)
MKRKLLIAAVAAAFVVPAGCRHHCHKSKKDDCCPPASGSGPITRNPILLPPANVPVNPGPAVPGPSNFPPPNDPLINPGPIPGPAAKPNGGPEVLFPEPIPGNPSARPVQPKPPGVLGAPVKPQTAEPPKAAGVNATRVKDGLYAGRRPTLDEFDALKTAGFRSVVYLHGPGSDTAAVKDMAATRGLAFLAIETTPETLADASAEFNKATADRLNRPAYVFTDQDARAGAVWYLHLRTVDALGDDVARLRARPLGLTDQGDEGRAFALAIQRILESK